MKNNTHFLSYLIHFFLEWKVFQRKVAEKIKAHILWLVTFLRNSCRLWESVDKYCRPAQATDDNMEHAHCVPVTKCVHTRTSLASESGWARVPMSQTRPCVECHEPDFGRFYIQWNPRVTTRLTYKELGLRPKILVLTYDQSLELRHAWRS
jgi:hypothetical protein